MARPLRERLAFDLERNRAELVQVVTPIEDLTYAPATGMKTYRDQIVEIGATEAETVALLTTGKAPGWAGLESLVPGTNTAELLESLARVRKEVLSCLDSLSNQELEEAIDVPHEIAPFIGDTSLERVELFRWLARHEYYHLGQIVTYRWIQGFDPYRPQG